MINVFGDNRIAAILQYFRNHSAVKINDLSTRLKVSERTIRNDIRQINDELNPYAAIEGKQGKYNLRIFDAEEFGERYAGLTQTDEFMNSSRNRMNYIFGRLMRSDEPILTDELAYEMNIGRTTIVSDLKKLREEIGEYGLKVVGKTSRGLVLNGGEIDIRTYVMENVYDNVYQDYPLDKEIGDIIEHTLKAHSFEKHVRENYKKFLTLMLDRLLTGHGLGKLSAKYYNLTLRPSYEIHDTLLSQISLILHTGIPLEERIYVFLPIIGMRTPSDINQLELVSLDDSIRPLITKIIEQIRLELNIKVNSESFADEFLYHMMFMLNRIRFRVKLENPLYEELVTKYPLAYRMAQIASSVIEEEQGMTVPESEKGYLTAYFGVFIAENGMDMEHAFRLAVVCDGGKVTAQLIEVQLRRVLDSSAKLDLYYDEIIDKEVLDQYDIVLSTYSLPFYLKRPVIQIREIFNEKELLHKIEKAKYWDQIDVPMLDSNWFVINGLLDENRFFLFGEEESYNDAVETMAESLASQGYVDDGFLKRLQEREEMGTMVFDRSIALPHTLQFASERLVLAIGVCEKGISHKGQNIRVIFLLGLPNETDLSDKLLIRIYDEIITIAQDENLLARISKVDSFQELIRVLYKQSIE